MLTYDLSCFFVAFMPTFMLHLPVTRSSPKSRACFLVSPRRNAPYNTCLTRHSTCRDIISAYLLGMLVYSLQANEFS